MTSKSNSWFVNNLTSPKGQLADFQHAARLFDDDDFRLAPKFKFQYHVSFSINPNALKSLNFTYRHQQEFNMLVKTAELPKFQIQTDTLNQYNRRKVTQVKLDYQPVTITFHEDNFNVVRMLWESYYSYYYADNDAAKIYGNYNRTAMLNSNFIKTPFGFDNGSHVPFFNNIAIYLMARHSWSMAKLINPVIVTFTHDTMNYADSNPTQNTMQLAYEAVTYDYGQVSKGNPPGFAQEHYDHTPSPLSLAGGGTSSVFGSGGVLAGAATVFGNIATGAAFQSPANFLTTAIQTINTYQNAKSLTKAGIKNELQNVAIKGLQTVARAGPGSVNNTVFPVNDTGNQNVTVGTPYSGGGGP
jgi:hypothetical protein